MTTVTHHPARAQKSSALFVTYIGIAATFFTLRIMFSPDRFPDYYTYVSITDDLYAGFGRSWYAFEPLSSGLLLLARLLSSNSLASVDVAYFATGLIFFVLLVLSVKEYRASWLSVLLVTAAYGHLLGFVTVRATPAYLLVAIAAVRASQGRTSSIALCLVASLFHISSLFALGPLLISFAQNRYGVLRQLNRGAGFIVGSGIVFGGLFLVFRETITTLLLDVIPRIPLIAKYKVYLTALEGKALSADEPGSAFDLAYLAITSLFFLFYVLQKDERCKAFRGYILPSFAIFLFLQFSPVSAFRQSIFWVIPAIMIIRWDKIPPRQVVGFLVLVASIGIFGVQFASLIR